MRRPLVETAWRILRSPNPELGTLKAWGQQIAVRRSNRIATVAVAVARRVAGILYAMWWDDVDYAASRPRAEAAERTCDPPLDPIRQPRIVVTDLGTR